MPDYRKMYLRLFEATEEALEVLEHSRDPDAPLIRALLTTTQQECENIFTKTDI